MSTETTQARLKHANPFHIIRSYMNQDYRFEAGSEGRLQTRKVRHALLVGSLVSVIIFWLSIPKPISANQEAYRELAKDLAIERAHLALEHRKLNVELLKLKRECETSFTPVCKELTI